MLTLHCVFSGFGYHPSHAFTFSRSKRIWQNTYNDRSIGGSKNGRDYPPVLPLHLRSDQRGPKRNPMAGFLFVFGVVQWQVSRLAGRQPGSPMISLTWLLKFSSYIIIILTCAIVLSHGESVGSFWTMSTQLQNY